jgi:glycosyltransferase involved in cell wall biosynthesis
MLFVHNTIAAPTLPFLKKIFRFVFFLDITDIHAEYLPMGKRSMPEKFLTPYLLKYEYFIIRSADFITVATRAMKEWLVAKGVEENRIEVVYDGADGESAAATKDEGAEYGIIHLGAVDRQHGVEILARAIPLVVSVFPRARFLFVGGGRELNRIRSIVGQSGMGDYCTFTDWLPREKAKEFLRKATIGIIPRHDAFPNTIITTLKIHEYWASKTAVISVPLAGIKEIAAGDKDVLWFQPGSAEDLANKIIFLLNNRGFKENLIRQGENSVKKFDWAKSASQISDFAIQYLYYHRSGSKGKGPSQQ